MRWEGLLEQMGERGGRIKPNLVLSGSVRNPYGDSAQQEVSFMSR
jgi:hypothetical protein